MTDLTDPSPSSLFQTELYELHRQHGGKMVPFAGYHMPLQYEMGIKGEHLHCRSEVGLFDVSHMGQAALVADDFKTAALALEGLVPGDILNLKPGRMRYSVLLNPLGGIEDDLMITHRTLGDGRAVVGLVVNAARKDHDYHIIEQVLPANVTLEVYDERALIALQGPRAAKVIAIWCAEAATMPYMSEIETSFFDVPCRISRAGYTGEDGFEISVPSGKAVRVTEMMLSYPEVKLIGLGARDSLRLEAGFCLYGHDIDDTTSPVEADLSWVVNKRRRQDGGFLGEDRILGELKAGPKRRRVGLTPAGASPPAREGAELFSAEQQSERIGVITSGGFSPSLSRPIAMGYVAAGYDQPGCGIEVEVRGKRYRWQVSALPFVPYQTYKAKKTNTH